MKNLLERLKTGEVLICDGATGTQLIAMGLKAGEYPEEWNARFPQKVASVHKGYVDAGCDIIITNTFGANRLKLKKAGLGEKTIEFNKKAVQIAKDSSNGKVYILGDIGPSGELLKPLGTLSQQEAENCFKEQIEILVSCGVDGIIFETFSDLAELKLAIKAAENTNLPKVASMTFQKVKDGFRTVMGVKPEEMLKINCEIIGSNCTLGSKEMTELAGYFRKIFSKDKILIMQPNAGMPILKNGKVLYPETPDDFGKFAKSVLSLGVNIIGGCCGTTPEHIKAVKEAIRRK